MKNHEIFAYDFDGVVSLGIRPRFSDDVIITGTIADNEVLAYDTTSSEWINQTAAEAGLAAASHTHAIDTDISGLGTGVATFLATPSSSNLATAEVTATIVVPIDTVALSSKGMAFV
jgi:hypothetical protein